MRCSGKLISSLHQQPVPTALNPTCIALVI
uniref:Uncharacterized protein n=1 Tax=Anguilla anguilla TaxID=7936 RepID=A0A0E9VJV8_ANGAN